MRPPFDTERELRRHGEALHGLAQALLRDGADADDVTQDAWLAALQSPPPRAHSTGGWLQTVVRRLAGRLRRARVRRAAREAAAARPEVVAAADEVAARSEVLHRVVDAVQGLEEPYRATVWQRFFEELPPSVIAQRSGVPVATVKSRLQRGLSMLRERLDRDGDGGEWRAGLATAFGIGSGVRVGAAAAAGVLVMGTAAKVVFGGAVAATAAAILWWATADAPIAPVAHSSGAAAPQVVSAEVDTAVAPPSLRTELPQEPLARVAPAPELELAQLRGRCVDDAGAPLAGVTVHLSGSARFGNDALAPRPGPWKNPDSLVTGADGRFGFAFAAAAELSFSLRARAEGRLPRSGSWRLIDAGQGIDLGDILLPAGVQVRGRVVDEDGAAVQGASVVLTALPVALAADMGLVGSSWGSSGVDGSFCIRDAIPPGVWPLELETSGLKLLAPDRVTIDTSPGPPVVVTVRRTPTIEGVVLDTTGAPVAGVSVVADTDREGRRVGGTSREDGAFTIQAVDVDPQPIRLRIDDAGPCDPTWHDERLWPWGSRDVHVVLPRSLSFELRVVEGATGAPVTRFAVSCYGERSRSSRDSAYRLSGEHADGRVTVDRVWRGNNSLLVMPLDPDLLPSRTIGFEATDAGIPAMLVELERLLPARVRVTTSSGEAVNGSKVEVVQKGGRSFDARSVAYDLRRGARDLTPDPRFRRHELISKAVTAADGTASLFLPVDMRDLAVRVSGQHATAIVDPVVLAPGQELAVVLPDSGGIVGTVLLAGLDPTRLSIEFCGSDRRWVPGADRLHLERDGTFAYRGLAPGRYRVELRSDGRTLDLQVPDVAVSAGRDSEVRIDATALVPANLRGRLLLDGAVPSPARAYVQAERGHLRGPTRGPLVPDADGVFEAKDLLPGTYRVLLATGDLQDEPGDLIEQEETFVLAPGQSLARDFAFVHRRLEVTVVEADGHTPAVGLEMELWMGLRRRICQTDARGVAAIDPAPSTRVLLTLPNRVGRLWDPVVFPEGATRHAVTLTLPAAK